MRLKRLLKNTGVSVLNQLVILICGLILPRLIIAHYGSATNGLVSSIAQFLAFFSGMEMGVGAVVQSSLFKPLAEKDNDGVSRILISSRRFFRKIGLALPIYTVLLMAYFCLRADHTLEYLPMIALVAASAFSALTNYLFGIVYQQLLNADQRAYVQLLINALTLALYTACSVVLIRLGASIVMVKLLSAVVLLIRPILLKLYVDRHYHPNLKLKVTGEPLKQKWNGLAQHIATYVLKYADIVILTVVSTLNNVSVYYVYHLVTNGLYRLIEILPAGFQSLLGDMYAKKETEKLSRTFSAFEWMIHTIVSVAYTVGGMMILPFVEQYTRNIADLNYIEPVFAALIILANATFSLRMPYLLIVTAVGHFKETQNSAIIEAVSNVVISVILVRVLGLVGVAIGTLVAMLYRTCYLAWYLKKHILKRPLAAFLKHMAFDVLMSAAIVFSCRLVQIPTDNWGMWLLRLAVVIAIAVTEAAALNLLVYRGVMLDGLRLVAKRFRQQAESEE